MGCGLSRPWRRRPREASVQSIRPLPESSDGEEETPLLLAVREELCDKAADEPEIAGGSEASSGGEEEETPLLLAVREELCDKAADEPEIHGRICYLPSWFRGFRSQNLWFARPGTGHRGRWCCENRWQRVPRLACENGGFQQPAQVRPRPCFTDQMRRSWSGQS